ncbi:MAG: cytidine/deoxycytidylate deaminase family protein [Bacillota bacterium]
MRDELAAPWRACLEEAWTAHCAGSAAIGAVIIDDHGHELAEVLTSIDCYNDEKATYETYSSMEPCPMCLGAFYMSGLRALRYAAPDPWAGAVDLLGATPYMSRKAIRVERGPENLALLSLALNVESTLRRDTAPRAEMFLETWAARMPRAVLPWPRAVRVGGTRPPAPRGGDGGGDE